MQITLDFTTLTEEVKRSLSIIGKRSIDENGNLMYKDITLGSLEEPLLNDYFQQAVIDLTTETDTFITASTDTSLTLTFPSNHNDALDSVITKVCKAFCVSYALYSWFSIVAPRLVEKYMGDCKRQVGELVRLIHNKKAPSASSSDYTDVTGEIVTDTGEETNDSGNTQNGSDEGGSTTIDPNAGTETPGSGAESPGGGALG